MAKVFLALIDGMRPDSLTTCNHPFFRELLQTSRYTMHMRTIMPSVTLPCHMSLFHGVCAERHGILTNTYVPQVRPVNGICEHLAAAGKSCAFFYTWEPLKDLSRPQSLARANYYSGKLYSFEKADALVTDDAERMLRSGDAPDFIFFYQCNVDEVGHKYGWMSDEYIASVKEKAIELSDKFYSGKLPVRVTHNDTKSNNVLFDKVTKLPLIVIDLDTVMPGMSMYDFGDAARFIANTSVEDEENLDKVSFNIEAFKALAEGYIGELIGHVTDEEILSLPLATFSITIELASRFLDDYITGDLYFKTLYPKHNLVRARCQLKLAQSIMEQYNELCKIVNELYKK